MSNEQLTEILDRIQKLAFENQSSDILYQLIDDEIEAIKQELGL